MANNGIEEIITTLYEMVQDAWSLPLGNEKCVVERDKVLDLLDEISNQLPGELKQAKTIVESRNEVITNAKREAENILKQAEQRAKQMISREEITRQAAQQADGGSASAGRLAVGAGNAHLHHIGFAFGTLKSIDLDVSLRVNGAQILLYCRAGGRGRIENINEFNDLLDQHGKNLLSKN